MERTAEADHKLGDSGIYVPKGLVISIPTYAIHKDPKIFPNPDSFDPDMWVEFYYQYIWIMLIESQWYLLTASHL